MKKLIALILIISVVMCLSSAVCWAADNHGADAQSESMSAESGEAPIPDANVTQEAGGEEVIDAEPADDSEEPLTEDQEDGNQVDEEAANNNTEKNVKPALTERLLHANPKCYVVGGAVLIVLIAVIALAAGKKRRNTYHSKH
ncbi:MAG: hypothetical protein KBS63_00020 [Clostridiales bacterium]|nr:hypothetical protein [Candidatus Crickella caballi]